MTGALGLATWFATAAGLVLFMRRFTRVPLPARFFLTALLTVTLVRQSLQLSEWLGVTGTPGAYIGYIELLLPFLWGGFL